MTCKRYIKETSASWSGIWQWQGGRRGAVRSRECFEKEVHSSSFSGTETFGLRRSVREEFNNLTWAVSDAERRRLRSVNSQKHDQLAQINVSIILGDVRVVTETMRITLH